MITTPVDLNLDIACAHGSGWLLGIMSLLAKGGRDPRHRKLSFSKLHRVPQNHPQDTSIAYKKKPYVSSCVVGDRVHIAQASLLLHV